MTQVATAVDADVAFEEFFEAERGKLFGAVYLMTGSVEEAEEIVQDSFLAVWERWGRVRVMENTAGYLYRTAMNRFRSRRRHLAYVARRALPLSGSPPACQSPSSAPACTGSAAGRSWPSTGP